MDTQAYKERLVQMHKDITAELSAVGIHTPENPSDWIAVPKDLDAEEPDLNLAADAVEEWNERAGLVATLETRYNNIVRAIRKIESGAYGTCEVCKKQIEEDRLSANPAARTCKEHMDDESTLR